MWCSCTVTRMAARMEIHELRRVSMLVVVDIRAVKTSLRMLIIIQI